GRIGNAANAVGATGELGPVVEQDTNDFTEAEGHDGQVVASQPQHREPEQESEGSGQQGAYWQREPERYAEVLREQGKGVSANGVERHIREGQQAGKADNPVQPEGQHDVDQHQRTEVNRATGRHKWPDQSGNDQQREEGAFQALPFGLRHRLAVGERADGREFAQGAHDAVAEQLEQEHRHRGQQDRDHCGGVGAGQHHIGAPGFQVEPENRVGNDECNNGTKQCVPEILSSHQIFSTSGLPSRPVGLKSKIRISRPKDTTSLYSPLRYPEVMLSETPRISPPSMAPGMLPMPPRTAAVNAFRPAMKPNRGSMEP